MPAGVYELSLGGQPAAPGFYDAIRSLEVTERSSGASSFVLRLGIVRDANGEWTLAEDAAFELLSEIGVELGFAGGSALEPVLRGYVTRTALRLAADPQDAVFEVSGTDASILLSLEDKIRAWPSASDGDIAQQILGEYDCTPEVTTTAPTRQDNETLTLQRGNDADFLRALARRNGFELAFASGPSGDVACRFGPPQLDGQPQADLAIRFGEESNLLSFDVSLDGARPLAVTARQLDARTRADSTADASATGLAVLGRDVLEDLVSGPLGTLVTPLAQQGALELLAQPSADTTELGAAVQAMRDQAGWLASARGEINSEAYGHVLRAGRTVLVKGAGNHHSGRYYVTRVTHRLDASGSYRQLFEARRNARGLDGSERFTSPGREAIPTPGQAA